MIIRYLYRQFVGFSDQHGGTYYGDWKNGVIEGHGKYTYRDDGEYDGEWKAGVKEGHGVWKYANRDEYVGEFKADQKEGHGVYTWANRDQYVGEWKAGVKEGHGVWKYANDDEYVGEFKADQKEGHGKFTWANRDQYVGEWKADQKEGRGVFTWANRDQYEGEWKADQREGRGVFTYANRDQYDGEWEANLYMEGRGVVITYANGDKYEGEFKNGLREGRGVFKYTNDAKYEGEWKANQREGQGVFTYANRDQYVGEFKADQKEGHGVFTYANGDQYDGEWKAGVKEGHGVWKYTNGNKYCGEWKAGQRCSGYIEFPNSDFYYDNKASTFLKGKVNIFPIKRNDAEGSSLVLKTFDNEDTCSREYDILKTLSETNKEMVVNIIEQINKDNLKVVSSTQERLCYGLILQRGKVNFRDYVRSADWKYVEEGEKNDHMKKMVDIVSYINRNGFIWRDIELTNFVFFPVGRKKKIIKAIDFDIALSKKNSSTTDISCTPKYAPPEICEWILSPCCNPSRSDYTWDDLTRFERRAFDIDETYDSWSLGLVFLEILEEKHYVDKIINMSKKNIGPTVTVDERYQYCEVITKSNFLDALTTHINQKFESQANYRCILHAMLCEQKSRLTANDIQKNWRLTTFGSTDDIDRSTDDIRKIIEDTLKKIISRSNLIQDLNKVIGGNIMSKLQDFLNEIKENTLLSNEQLREQLQTFLSEQVIEHPQAEDTVRKVKEIIETENNDMKISIIFALGKHIEAIMIEDRRKFDERLKQMKDSIVDELTKQNTTQYNDMKLVMTQIQSSMPNDNDRKKLEEFISSELSRVMICVEDKSCKTEVSTLRKTLLHQLCDQNCNLETIKDQLQKGFTTINISLEEVHSKLDPLTQKMVDFQLDLCAQLDALKEEEIDLAKIEGIVRKMGGTNKEIEELQSKKKISNKDIMNLILSWIPMINTNLLSNQESLTQLQSDFKKKCEESKEDQAQLRSVLADLSQVFTTVNEKMDSLTENVINIKTEFFELDLSKFQKEQKEELQNVHNLLKEINENNSYKERQEELFQKLQGSQSQLLQEMKDKLESKKNSEKDSHESLQQNALQNLESQLNFLLRQTERQTEIMIDFIKGKYELPKYFTILPKSLLRDEKHRLSHRLNYFLHPSRWGKTKFKLFFHCGCCKEIPKPACGTNGAGYSVEDASTLQKFAPMIKITVCLMRLSGAVIGFPFPTSNGVIDELDELSTKFIGEDYGEDLNKEINEIFSSKDWNLELNGELKQTTDKCYRQLKALMETLDPQLENTGLTKVEGGYNGAEKSIEWVCESCKEGFQAEGRNYQPVSGA